MIAKRTEKIKPFLVMEILEKAYQMEKKGESVIHLEVGEPDFETPKVIKEAVFDALKAGKTNYTPSLGDLELRESICRYYLRKYRVVLSPEQIIITSGTSPALLLLFAALLNPQEEVIISDPHYACYPNFIEFMQGKVVKIPVYEEDGFQYRLEKIKKSLSFQTKAILINSPSNPTGTVLSAEKMRSIASYKPYIISDEIYHGLVYEGEEHSILEFTDKAFVLNGFSKLYAMTGLRLGYLIAPQEFIRPMQKIQQNLFISANSVIQRAGIVALEKAEPDVHHMKKIYNKRRKYMINRLKKLGFDIKVEPTGAFYVFVKTTHLDKDSYRLAFDILEKAKVGVTPGIDFGQNGEGYLRFSYANSIDNIIEGLNRIEKYISFYY